MLLRKHAPVSIGFPEAGLVKALNVPKRFKLCRKNAKRAQAPRDRELSQEFPETQIEMTDEMLLQEIEDDARHVPFKQALTGVARQYGMVDVGGRLLWSANFIKKARRLHTRARREHRDYIKSVVVQHDHRPGADPHLEPDHSSSADPNTPTEANRQKGQKPAHRDADPPWGSRRSPFINHGADRGAGGGPIVAVR